MPINVFWEMEQHLKQLDYLVASNEDAVLINTTYQTIVAKAAKYAVAEKDRIILKDKSTGPMSQDAPKEKAPSGPPNKDKQSMPGAKKGG